MTTARGRKGFVIILAVVSLAVLFLSGWAIIGLGCGEMLQTRMRNNYLTARYLAYAGAQRMYAHLYNIQQSNGTVTWPLSISSTNVQVGSDNIGSYSVTANLTSETGVFMIASTGRAGGRTARVTVKYGFTSTYTNGLPFGSIGPMDLEGDRWWFLTSWVYAEGPIQSASAISPPNNSNSVYVRYTGDVTQNSTGIAPASFWLGATFDTDVSGSAYVDGDGSNSIDSNEVPPEMAADFAGDDVNNDGVIDDADAFYHYYTAYLDTQNSLSIAPGEANYYTGDQTFGPWTVPAGTNIIFVDGDVNIILNAQQWWSNASDFTIVSTGDITVVQPVNGTNDRLTLIAHGDFYTGGINLGDIADVDGNLVVYTGGDFTAILGGSTNGSFFAGGDTYIHTGLPSFFFNRDMNQGTDNWLDPANRPLGLPPDYPIISKPFVIKAKTLGVSATSYNPRWQLR